MHTTTRYDFYKKVWNKQVNYTIVDLKNHLEKTIPNGYDWEDYINGKLQVDHIIPISAFNFTSANHTDFKRCWALENLRLLPSKENSKKSYTLNQPFQPALRI